MSNNNNTSQPSKIGEFNDGSLRNIAKEIVMRRLILKVHGIVYLLVNLLLFIINIMTNSQYWDAYSSSYTNKGEYLWHLWPIVCWGIALLIHAFNYVTYRKGLILSASAGFIAYHTFVYCIVNGLLLFINWFTQGIISWALWPLGFWGFGLIIHVYIYYSHKPKKGEDSHKSWFDRQVEAEMKKAQKP